MTNVIGKALFKYNGGALALLCSECRVIIKEGKDFDEYERAACKARLYHPPQYCATCKTHGKICTGGTYAHAVCPNKGKFTMGCDDGCMYPGA